MFHSANFILYKWHYLNDELPDIINPLRHTISTNPFTAYFQGVAAGVGYNLNFKTY